MTQLIIGGVVVCVLLGCVTVLAWHGTIDGQAAIAIFSSLGLGGIVGAATHAATNNGAKAALKEPTKK